MRCATSRERLQNWFDQPGAPGLPPDLARHIGECGDCRAYVKRWNAIEVELQALRLEGPQPSCDLAAAVRARIHAPALAAERRLPFPVRRLALVGAACAVLAAAILAVFGQKLLAPSPRANVSTLAIMRSAGPPRPGPGGLPSDLPLAETR